MKAYRVIGKLSLNKPHPTIAGRCWVLAQPLGLQQLMHGSETDAEELVAIDDMGASPFALVGISEGAEATNPYLPDRKPVDAYVSCILDQVDIEMPR